MENQFAWDEDQEFQISGKEFGNIKGLVNAVMNCDEVGRVIMAMRTDEILKRIFDKGVKDGTIKEKVESNLVLPNKEIVGAPASLLMK